MWYTDRAFVIVKCDSQASRLEFCDIKDYLSVERIWHRLLKTKISAMALDPLFVNCQHSLFVFLFWIFCFFGLIK